MLCRLLQVYKLKKLGIYSRLNITISDLNATVSGGKIIAMTVEGRHFKQYLNM